MKRTGPPKTPTDLKLLTGTFRQDRALPNEPQPPRGIPPMPEHLTKRAQEEWNRIAPMLSKCGVLRESDLAILTLYCDAWGRYQDLTVAVAKVGKLTAKRSKANATTEDAKALYRALEAVFGEVEKFASGTIQIRQLAIARRQAAQDVHRFALELGLTAAARTRISIPDQALNNIEDADPATKYFA